MATENSSLVLTNEGGLELSIELLGNEADFSAVQSAWEEGGQDALIAGNACYTGTATDVVIILNDLSDTDFLGDEYSIQNIVTSTPGQISFDIFDRPNDEVMSTLTIRECSIR